jgi:hypothetical protein
MVIDWSHVDEIGACKLNISKLDLKSCCKQEIDPLSFLPLVNSRERKKELDNDAKNFESRDGKKDQRR